MIGFQDVDNLTLRRFLRARDHDVEKASAMFLKYLAWKRSFIPNGHISVREIQNEIAQNKQFMQGFDKQGRPITVMFGCKHFQNKKGGVDELKRMLNLYTNLIRILPFSILWLNLLFRLIRLALKFHPIISSITGFAVFALEKLCSRYIILTLTSFLKHTKLFWVNNIYTYQVKPWHTRMPTGQEKFVVIADLKGWGYSNCDIRGMLGTLSILQVWSSALCLFFCTIKTWMTPSEIMGALAIIQSDITTY